jgi:curli biogenesis system outer membrane secretion channel CsgG
MRLKLSLLFKMTHQKFLPNLTSVGTLAALCSSLWLAGCNQKAPEQQAAAPAVASVTPAKPATEPVAAAPAPVAAPTAPASPVIPGMDVGKLESVKVTSDGFGNTASEAVAEAMRLAILQVNGAALDMTQVNTQFGLDATLNQTAVSMRGAAFSDGVRQRSGGVVQNFRIISLLDPAQANGKFKASIEASISKFIVSADMKKIKLAIAPLRFDRVSIPMGDKSVGASQVGAQLRARIQEALVATGRFAVLDRDFSPEIEAELDRISGGAAPRAELEKLSQAASADIIWIGKINGLAYNKSSRQLQTSDRQLVSYSGGWSISEKLVNVATRQVISSNSLRGSAPSTAPTTLSTGVNSGKVLGGMTDDLVNQVVASIMSRTFPVSIVSVDGSNVVLSQGGQTVAKGTRYAVVTMGAEMKDPQTGQSLGRTEMPCCEVVVDRVTPNLSYGHIENGAAGLDKLAPGSLVVREKLRPGQVTTADASASQAKPASTDTSGAAKKPIKRASNRSEGSSEVAPDTRKNNDDKW